MLSAAVFQAIMNVTALVELLLPLLARVLQSHHHQQSMGLASSQPELQAETPGQDNRETSHEINVKRHQSKRRGGGRV